MRAHVPASAVALLCFGVFSACANPSGVPVASREAPPAASAVAETPPLALPPDVIALGITARRADATSGITRDEAIQRAEAAGHDFAGAIVDAYLLGMTDPSSLVPIRRSPTDGYG